MVKKVLFINNQNPGSIIPELLAGTGYNVTTVFSADSGLECLESGAFDIVILMENAAAGSWAVCTGIRRLTTSPFIVISPGASAESCVKAIEVGADFFMRKPFGPMELMARINALFQRTPVYQPAPTIS